LRQIESSRHLQQLPLYRASNGSWSHNYDHTLAGCGDRLTWDPAAILSIIAFNYACGDRTLLSEITRRPWLSRVDDEGQVRHEPIPPHGTLWLGYGEIAAELRRRLCQEALEVCRDRSEIYIPLSGGLDSRIVAATVTQLYREGRIAERPVAVTWGVENSRDVIYGRAVAKLLGLEWIHVSLEPVHVMENIETAALKLGALLSPNDLHRFSWFKNVSSDALVLSPIAGDSIGRSVYCGATVLELRPHRPVNYLGLLKPEVAALSYRRVLDDLEVLKNRAPYDYDYQFHEREGQAHYVRGMLSQLMSIVSHYCDGYRMFTHPSVYSFMWSLHPSLRTNEVYAALLEDMDPRLLSLPWAETNRALKGRTEGAMPTAQASTHNYFDWITGPLWNDIRAIVDPDWFAATEMFDADAVRRLGDHAREGTIHRRLLGYGPLRVWTWLAAFRRFAEHLERSGKTVCFHGDAPRGESVDAEVRTVPLANISTVRRLLGRIKPLQRCYSDTRRYLLRWQASRRYPPQFPDTSDRPGALGSADKKGS
jgi:asparagine synthase (glutamine-hydrolysing)